MEKKKKSEQKKYPWTARRIVALIGILLLLGLYASTLVFALLRSPNAKGLLMAAIYCTIAVPVLLFAMAFLSGRLRGTGLPPAEEDASDDTPADTDGSSSEEDTAFRDL